MWAPISSKNAQSQVTQRLSLAPRLSLTSWNINAFPSRPISRANFILQHTLEGPKPPDVIFPQEVTPGVRDSLLGNARVRAAFLATDAEDRTSFENVPFATMTLLSNSRFASRLDSQKEGGRTEGGGKVHARGCLPRDIPSKYGRDALHVDITPPTAPDTVFRLINVHLDSL